MIIKKYYFDLWIGVLFTDVADIKNITEFGQATTGITKYLNTYSNILECILDRSITSQK